VRAVVGSVLAYNLHRWVGMARLEVAIPSASPPLTPPGRRDLHDVAAASDVGGPGSPGGAWPRQGRPLGPARGTLNYCIFYITAYI
jgi:hypothetical protein